MGDRSTLCSVRVVEIKTRSNLYPVEDSRVEWDMEEAISPRLLRDSSVLNPSAFAFARSFLCVFYVSTTSAFTVKVGTVPKYIFSVRLRKSASQSRAFKRDLLYLNEHDQAGENEIFPTYGLSTKNSLSHATSSYLFTKGTGYLFCTAPSMQIT